jgi:hypothetical protein
MTCFAPIKGYRSKEVGKSGKRKLVFKPEHGIPCSETEIPCGQCIGCRFDKSRQWAVRAVHEAQMHEDNCFITLTYNEENIPEDRSVSKEVLQKFLKRYRKEINKHGGKQIRFMACGEYGHLRNRPHYHLLIFGWRDPQEYLWSKSKSGEILFRSPVLERAWTEGYSSVGNLTFQSAAYTARYVTKKVTGKRAKQEYRIFDKETGEIIEIQPEFALMSLGRRNEDNEELDNGGIGYKWYKKYFESDCSKDFITVNRSKMAIPDYYYRLLEQKDPERYEKIKELHREMAKKKAKDNTVERLIQKQKVFERRTENLVRTLEEI